jgi:Prenyltransferase and squalene oxidase repeat
MHYAESRMRNAWIPLVVGLAFCILHSASCMADDSLPPQLDLSVARGLAYLARQQQPDGSFTGFDENGPRALPAAEALLAFLSAGETPLAGRHSLVVRNAVEYLLRQLPDDGDFGRADGSGADGQALITIALAQVHGCEADPTQRRQIADALTKSLHVIVAMQDARNNPRAGGWNPEGRGEGELGTTLLMSLALRALCDAGVEVPDAVTTRAAGFVRSCAKPGVAGFAAKTGAAPTAASTACGIGALLALGAATPADLKDALKLIAERRIGDEETNYYLSSYAVSLCAMWSRDPAAWTAAWKPARDALMSKQTDDGSWFPLRPPREGLGTIPATSAAVSTLAMPYRLLPLYGR